MDAETAEAIKTIGEAMLWLSNPDRCWHNRSRFLGAMDRVATLVNGLEANQAGCSPSRKTSGKPACGCTLCGDTGLVYVDGDRPCPDCEKLASDAFSETDAADDAVIDLIRRAHAPKLPDGCVAVEREKLEALRTGKDWMNTNRVNPLTVGINDVLAALHDHPAQQTTDHGQKPPQAAFNGPSHD